MRNIFLTSMGDRCTTTRYSNKMTRNCEYSAHFRYTRKQVRIAVGNATCNVVTQVKKNFGKLHVLSSMSHRSMAHTRQNNFFDRFDDFTFAILAAVLRK